jgi:hypothetical protein
MIYSCLFVLPHHHVTARLINRTTEIQQNGLERA